MRYSTIALLIVLLGIVGCDFLNYNEEDFISEPDEVFQDFNRTRAMLTNLYSRLPDGFNEVGGTMRSSASDDAVEANSVSSISDFYNGSWSPINTPDDQWDNMYTGIRDANVFLGHFDPDIIEDRKYNEDYDVMKDQIQYFRPEARFLRAFYYFELLRRYGSVPLVKSPLSAEEANSVQVNSTEEIIDFIVSECNDIIGKLPVSYNAVFEQETGRATKGAAMALKARTLLYAASPLFNESNDQSKWEDAATASAEIINSNQYSLVGDYSNVVNNHPSSELILGRRIGASNWFEQANFPVGYQGEPGTCPTQNLVNTYEMSNGMDIDESGSGYDPSNPYANRDPRLQQTVIVNNSMWKGRNVEIWRGGLDGPPTEFATPTGYYLKKYLIEGLKITEPNPTSEVHLWVFFRYGEVLLNYAEAMNEAYGPNSDPEGYGMTAYQAVNTVRSRAGMPDFPGGMSQAEFRQELREERRVELAFENHRFWDIRRWKIGDVTEQIWGVKIENNGGGNFSYTKEVVQNRQWDDKMYLYPYPQSEVFINENLQQNQNPGW